ncbi:hypothetical protein BH20VER2_BH20VER2_17880 [soil metagenome]
MKTEAKLHLIKLVSRYALGLVWLYEGLVPKLVFPRADQTELVRNSGWWWHSPDLTLQLLGLAQIAVGLWLLTGWRERAAVVIATGWMLLLIVLVANGNPAMLTDPYGALVKDLCLIACATTVWLLAGRGPAEDRRTLTTLPGAT